jgi:hypothetical protein
VTAFQELKAILPIVVVTTNGTSNREHATALAQHFERASIEVSRGTQISNGPDETGVMIAAKYPSNLPESAKRILKIFREKWVYPKVTQLPAKIGAEFTVFIGPNPLGSMYRSRLWPLWRRSPMAVLE